MTGVGLHVLVHLTEMQFNGGKSGNCMYGYVEEYHNIVHLTIRVHWGEGVGTGEVGGGGKEH